MLRCIYLIIKNIPKLANVSNIQFSIMKIMSNIFAKEYINGASYDTLKDYSAILDAKLALEGKDKSLKERGETPNHKKVKTKKSFNNDLFEIKG